MSEWMAVLPGAITTVMIDSIKMYVGCHVTLHFRSYSSTALSQWHSIHILFHFQRDKQMFSKHSERYLVYTYCTSARFMTSIRIASVPVYKWTSLGAHSSILSNTLVWLTFAVISGIVKQHCLPYIFPEQRTWAGQLVGLFPASLFWYFYLREGLVLNLQSETKTILVTWRSESE